jgi:nucleoside-diphosphate-sugar epimerase
MKAQTLILGAGYTGQVLAEHLNAAYTRRQPLSASAIYFDLNQPDCWQNIPNVPQIIWTFPATPLEQVQAFYNAHLIQVPKLFVYASTSCYQVDEDDAWIDETQPLDLSRERVKSEEWLREHGATILVLAGIYGPNREPRNWLQRGLIKTPYKRLNLIHRDDIVAITSQLLNSDLDLRHQRINLADGEPLRWKEIAAHYGLSLKDEKEQGFSKRISHQKLKQFLPDYTFHRLFDV